jgi:hypothetical protein
LPACLLACLLISMASLTIPPCISLRDYRVEWS